MELIVCVNGSLTLFGLDQGDGPHVRMPPDTSVQVSRMKLRPAAFSLALCLLSGGTADARGLPTIKTSKANPVPSCATPGRLMAYLAQRNPKLPKRFSGIASHYMREGAALGVRWDYAFFQMIVETGALSFRRGNGTAGDVSPRQNNFAGLGATGSGEPGDAFQTIRLGVKAHLQHVLMYAGERIAEPIADRTRKVQEWGILDGWRRKLGRPVTFADLAQRWVPEPQSYIASIESVARRFYEGQCGRPDPRPDLVASVRRGASKLETSRVHPAQPAAPKTASGGSERSGLGAPKASSSHSTPLTRADAMSMPGVIIVYHERDVAAAADRARNVANSSKIPDSKATPASWNAAVNTPAASAPAKPVAVQPAGPHQRPEKRTTRVASLVGPAAVPKPPPTADEAMRAWVSGKTVLLDTALGTSIPMLFRPDGTSAGRAGTLAPFLGAAQDEGRWWIERNRLCIKWKVWIDGDVQCLRLRQAGSVIHWVRDDGKTGTARLVNR